VHRVDCLVPVVVLAVLLALAVALIIALGLYIIMLRRRPTLKPQTPGTLRLQHMYTVSRERRHCER